MQNIKKPGSLDDRKSELELYNEQLERVNKVGRLGIRGTFSAAYLEFRDGRVFIQAFPKRERI